MTKRTVAFSKFEPYICYSKNTCLLPHLVLHSPCARCKWNRILFALYTLDSWPYVLLASSQGDHKGSDVYGFIGRSTCWCLSQRDGLWMVGYHGRISGLCICIIGVSPFHLLSQDYKCIWGELTAKTNNASNLDLTRKPVAFVIPLSGRTNMLTPRWKELPRFW